MTMLDYEEIDLHKLRRRSPHFRVVDTYQGVVSDPATLHKYTYCHGDPVNYSDPSGHSEFSLVGILAVTGISLLLLTIPGDSPTPGSVHHAPTPPSAAIYQPAVASIASKYVGSKNWREDIDNVVKCNQFVFDVLKEAGYPIVFHRTWTHVYGPLAGEWADPTVVIPHWQVVPGGPAAAQPGDIIAEKIAYSDATGHVGIVIGPQQTASADSTATPPGLITITNYGFRPDNDPGHEHGWASKSLVRRYSSAP